MKKLMYFAAVLLVLVGCNKKDNALNNAPEGTPFKKGQQVTLTVGTGTQQGPNKVAGIDNTTNNRIDFVWEDGDKILVKVGDATAEFTLISGAGTDAGEFAGEMPAGGSNFDIQYPVDAPNLSVQEYTTEKKIPADKMLFTATGCTLGNNATLQAQYAMLQLNLYGTDKTIGKIVVTDISNIFDATKPVHSDTLICTEGVKIGADAAHATPFYMVVPAGTYKFEVRIWNSAETPAKLAWFGTSTAKTFKAGKCLNMPAKEVKVEHTYVDMGAAGKWATCNVGGVAPEDYGDYYAWGETSPKTTYDWDTYKYCKGSYDTQTKYCIRSEYGYNGFKDSKTTLEPEDDAAHVNWGGNWRMPTMDEFNELKDNCTWTWTNDYIGTGVKGRIVTINNGNNYIFLPAAGYRTGWLGNNVGSSGDYWSSSLDGNYSSFAYHLHFWSGSVYWENLNRYNGRSVRAVCQ